MLWDHPLTTWPVSSIGRAPALVTPVSWVKCPHQLLLFTLLCSLQTATILLHISFQFFIYTFHKNFKIQKFYHKLPNRISAMNLPIDSNCISLLGIITNGSLTLRHHYVDLLCLSTDVQLKCSEIYITDSLSSTVTKILIKRKSTSINLFIRFVVCGLDFIT